MCSPSFEFSNSPGKRRWGGGERGGEGRGEGEWRRKRLRILVVCHVTCWIQLHLHQTEPSHHSSSLQPFYIWSKEISGVRQELLHIKEEWEDEDSGRNRRKSHTSWSELLYMRAFWNMSSIACWNSTSFLIAWCSRCTLTAKSCTHNPRLTPVSMFLLMVERSIGLHKGSQVQTSSNYITLCSLACEWFHNSQGHPPPSLDAGTVWHTCCMHIVLCAAVTGSRSVTHLCWDAWCHTNIMVFLQLLWACWASWDASLWEDKQDTSQLSQQACIPMRVGRARGRRAKVGGELLLWLLVSHFPGVCSWSLPFLWDWT